MVVLDDFRRAFYRCLTGWGDALFAKGGIDSDRLRAVLVAQRPADWPAVCAVDASTWARCDAETSPERGFYYTAAKHPAGQPIVAGWSYQWITQLGWAANSWTAPVDALRIPPTTDTTTATIDQLRRLVGLLGDDGPVPMFVFDAGYDPIALTHELADTRAQVLVWHGARFALADDATWTAPDAELVTDDARYGTVKVTAWSALHPKLHGRGRWRGHDEPPIVRGTVIRVA
ncbi:MAG: hypothetical protein ACRDZN_05255, partial [Acidimicrobiales bacterium]